MDLKGLKESSSVVEEADDDFYSFSPFSSQKVDNPGQSRILECVKEELAMRQPGRAS